MKTIKNLLLVLGLFVVAIYPSVAANATAVNQPYRVVLQISQNGTNAPTIVVFENDFPGITFSSVYLRAGEYLVVASKPIFNGGTQKTSVIASPINAVYLGMNQYRSVFVYAGPGDGTTTDSIMIATGQDGGGNYTLQNDILNQHFFEITVYP